MFLVTPRIFFFMQIVTYIVNDVGTFTDNNINLNVDVISSYYCFYLDPELSQTNLHFIIARELYDIMTN